MPLKLIKRGAVYHVRGTVAGSYLCETTGTSDAKRAEAYRAKREAELWDRRVYGDRAVVTFAEAALSYLDSKPARATDKAYIQKLVDHFGRTQLGRIDQSAVDKACRALLRPDAAPATKVRSVITPLCAILNHAARRGWCEAPKFERPAAPPGKTRFLLPDEALRLEAAAAPHLQPLIRFLLCTGARLSEALELDWQDVDLAAAKAMFWRTKGGRPRAAALPPATVAALANLDHREGQVFRRDDGEPYVDRERMAGGQIKTAFAGACRRAQIRDLTPHDLRHTWASWFYAACRDPFLLRDEGGWATVTMVERYAHLMPSSEVAGITSVWGPSHPRIGVLTCTPSAQPTERRA